MQRPSKYEMLHAMRYAYEHTKKYTMELYRQTHPLLFQYAHMEIRPATREDYYIPPSLVSECIVVTKTYFSKEGCVNVSCFPFRSDGLPCSESDSMRWMRVGSSYTLACQPSCRASKATVDVEWRNEKCVRVNPFKKYLAVFPEMLFGVKTKNPLHLGLEWKDGKIYLNETYCKAYGLDFDGYDCSESVGQTIAEYFLGTTVYRGIKIKGIKPPSIPPPPPLPDVSVDFPDLPVDLPDIPTDSNEYLKSIVSEFAFDFGVDIAMDVAKKILKKRAPRLLAKAADNIPVKAALAQMLLKNYVQLGVKSLKAAGKLIGRVDTVFTLYSIIAVVLDIFDPLNFGNVLAQKQVENLDKRLDMLYFERENNFSPELTPEFVWDYVLVREDQSDQTEYYAEKLNEYLNALRVGDAPNDAPASLFDFDFDSETENKNWDWTIHIVVMLMLVILAILYVEWVHMWALLVLFAVIIMGNSSDTIL